MVSNTAEYRRLKIPARHGWFVNDEIARKIIYHAYRLEKKGIPDPFHFIKETSLTLFDATSKVSAHANVGFGPDTPIIDPRTFRNSNFPYFNIVKENYTTEGFLHFPKNLQEASDLTGLSRPDMSASFVIRNTITQDERSKFIDLLLKHEHIPNMSGLCTTAFRWYERMWFEQMKGQKLLLQDAENLDFVVGTSLGAFDYK